MCSRVGNLPDPGHQTIGVPDQPETYPQTEGTPRHTQAHPGTHTPNPCHVHSSSETNSPRPRTSDQRYTRSTCPHILRAYRRYGLHCSREGTHPNAGHDQRCTWSIRNIPTLMRGYPHGRYSFYIPDGMRECSRGTHPNPRHPTRGEDVQQNFSEFTFEL